MKIYGLPAAEIAPSFDIADACYRKGGSLLRTLDTDAITGLNITEYECTVLAGETVRS